MDGKIRVSRCCMGKSSFTVDRVDDGGVEEELSGAEKATGCAKVYMHLPGARSRKQQADRIGRTEGDELRNNYLL